MMDEPLLDGAGQSNAYIIGPEIGPNGKYHMMWRDIFERMFNRDNMIKMFNKERLQAIVKELWDC
ncbi:hypothetical protein HMPREF9446_01533 [Bacteroides fluxus YIT 12057]|uniref:Uncharacterized protein n=1 Tax=Bacteroides fluxus YIT 12057 TaxID=763034 RepID=F3PS29_9BACE|nr:hypothetical protein HMPREF9446_01533 [Bacteroides fluxus YIT 12057]